MWRALFSYRGEMGRMAFVGWTLALFAGVTVPALLILGPGRAVLPGTVSALLAFVVVGAPLLWCGFALQAKRFRHMGVSPVVGIATGVLVGPALKAVALTLPRAHLDAATLGAVWSYGLLGVLALWPGRNRLAQGPADTVMEFD